MFRALPVISARASAGVNRDTGDDPLLHVHNRMVMFAELLGCLIDVVSDECAA